MGLRYGPEIWAKRLGGGGGAKKEEKKKEEKKEEEEEKIPHLCESIGHRPLRGRYPKERKRIQFLGPGVVWQKICA